MTIGVITHLRNATILETCRLAAAAEEAGADWIGVPDAFWWRDTWVLLAEVARVTRRIAIGPMVTNPYLRHPFHTLAALATVQELAGPRVFLGVGAGGSEVTGAARIPRSDAPARVTALVELLRSVEGGEALDPESGRSLEVPLEPVAVLVAGRTDGMLRAAGQVGDRALLWAVPRSELLRAVELIAEGGAARRTAPGPRPRIVWAPLVAHDDPSRERIRTIAAYAVLNSRRAVRRAWGLDDAAVDRLRATLVAGGAPKAAGQVPVVALDDLVVEPDAEALGAQARALGVDSIALPAFDIGSIGDRVDWARAVLRAAAADVPSAPIRPTPIRAR